VVALGLPPDQVVVAPPGAVLKTSSGKIRRGATREAYVRGRLARRRSPGAQWAALLARDVAARLGGLGARLAALAFAARAGAVLLVGFPLLALLLPLAPRGRPADRLVRWWSRLVLALSGCRPRAQGLERLAGVAPAVLVANHASYLDALLLLATLPIDCRFVAKRELTRVPLVGAVIRRVGHPTVERADVSRSVEDAAAVAALLRGGTSLCVFPEGTFVREPGLLPFRLGAFKAAVEAGCPVVPIALRGTRDVLPAGTWLPRPGRLSVAVGTPIRAAEPTWREMLRLRDEARTAIEALLAPRPSPSGEP
jgi:1-acyl-sn-glycerol-3-phosphate acyltransferase